MQTTIARHDYREDIKRLNRRLKEYRITYQRESTRMLAEWMSDHNHVTKHKHGYCEVHLPYEIEHIVDAQFPDLKDVRNPYRSSAPYELVRRYSEFWEAQIRPINDQIEAQVKAHWEQVWRTERIDFRALPPAPARRYLPGPARFTVINRKEHRYQFGQITVQIEGERKYRCIVFFANGVRLWEKRALDTTINDCLTIALPLAQRFDRLCDWSAIHDLSDPARNALGLKMEVIQDYCMKEYDRNTQRLVPGWASRLRLRQFPMYYDPERLQAVLQAEKDRHAPRRKRQPVERGSGGQG